MKSIKKIVSVILASVLICSAVGCGSTAKKGSEEGSPTKAEATDKLSAIKKSGKLVLGTSADYPPYEFHKLIDGKDQIVGFDITIAQEIAKKLGVELEIKDIAFKGLTEAVKTDKVDIVLAGMVPDEKRKKEVDFSDVYYVAKQAVIVRTEDKGKYSSVKDFAGKKVGVQLGTIQEGLAKDHMTGAEIKSLDKITELVMELKTKKVDALVVEYPVATSYAEKNSDMFVTDMKFDDAYQEKGSAAAMKKGNEEFVKAVNDIIKEIVASKQIDKYVADATALAE